MTAFLKMHGLGNDFVVFDARDSALALDAEQVRAIADRRRGIGCDTVVMIRPGGATADAAVVFYNADGAESESCGNATRCVARFLMDERGLARVRLSSRAGMLTCGDAGKGLVTVDMGEAQLDWEKIPMAKPADTVNFPLQLAGSAQPSLAASAVSIGNPHCVLFVPDAEKAPVAQLGPRIETLALFPNRINVEFAQVLDRKNIRMRVWERGIGITEACGTGACATVVAAVRRGLTERKVDVALDGGVLSIEWLEDGHVLMTGPTAMPFRGYVDINKL
ncbi:MAG: diaminopimelate epimerase [Alphaproteobacteria bacterium 64-11]|nr:diaminopimelate epimerase [Alphaproteobacteria bacterium]OJU10361.1 MAG: diaminopimelate epimerase [Alphaproteobacteria bacterium 64-11]